MSLADQNFFLPNPVESPCLIISSLAGLGNYRTAQAIEETLPAGCAQHLPLDRLVPENLRRQAVGRYRFLCERAPFLLRFLYVLPIGYTMRYYQEKYKISRGLEDFGAKLSGMKVRTVIALNHRAGFWVSALKRRSHIQCRLIGVMTDYAVSSGWLKLFHEEFDEFWGPLKQEEVPAPLRAKYHRTAFPVCKDILEIKGSRPDPYQVLVSGGGWGLGPMAKVVEMLSRISGLKIYVVCGANEALLSRLRAMKYANTAFYGALPSLAPLMRICASVVTKPGAVTLSEAAAAGRKIFLLRGLPVIEEKNAAYARKRFAAEIFTSDSFERWLKSGR